MKAGPGKPIGYAISDVGQCRFYREAEVFGHMAMRIRQIRNSDFQKLSQGACALVQAGRVKNQILQRICQKRILKLIADLRASCGDLPMLLDIQASYMENDQASIRLRRRAISLARLNEESRYHISLSLAETYLYDRRKLHLAERELLICRKELLISGDKWEKKTWKRLFQKCAEIKRKKRLP